MTQNPQIDDPQIDDPQNDDPQNDDPGTDNEETSPRRRHRRITYTDHKIDRKLDRERRNRENEFRKLVNKLNTEITDLKQFIKNENVQLFDDAELIQPYEENLSLDNRPQLNKAGIQDHNQHLKHLSNHELHQIKSMKQIDHRNKIHTVLDEPVGQVLDKTINFLGYSFDDFYKKIYEAELMENIHGEKTFYESIKVNLIAFLLFFRDKDNVLYIGITMVFLSIIIYFINIITIQND